MEMKHTNYIKYRGHKWDWCAVCDCACVICGTCGNNCCNGTNGCEDCDSAYELQLNAPPDFSEEYKKAKQDKYDEFWDTL